MTNTLMDGWLLQQRGLDITPTNLRELLASLHTKLDRQFENGVPVADLIETLTLATDSLIQRVWDSLDLSAGGHCALLAVGGYGRGELHPGSDIDILVLLDGEIEPELGDRIGQFFTFLWDMRFDLGNSVRTIDACIEEGANDLTIATTFFESRLLVGSQVLFDQLTEQINQPDFWPSHQFFKAKLEEQQARHTRFGDTAYRIEPNLKESPGGLRDIQILSWIVTRHFSVETLRDLIKVGFLNEEEFQILDESRNFLWRLRYGLHRLAGKKEDRLLLEHQKSVAAYFGYLDTTGNLAVEQFMKQYFRVVTDIQRLNEMLLQLFEEQITLKNILSPPQSLNDRFQSRSGYIEIKNSSVFENDPYALLELFLLLQQSPQLVGVRATTIRAVRSHLYLIDDAFRQDSRCQNLFMEILAQPAGIYHEFRRMNTYGVLAAYLPEFSAVVGLMQFDLFHAYTVDEHTIMVMRYARRLSVEKYSHEVPACSKVFTTLRNPALLYIACLYHDIAKGRGGDHSELGQADAVAFCHRHSLSNADAELVAWLVKQHLIMSTISQRNDISDPDVINEFVAEVKTEERLKYLYLLTVSDIRGTSSKLWNSWKSSLLNQLYRSALNTLLSEDSERPHAENLLNTSSTALEQLLSLGFHEDDVLAVWEVQDTEYFQRQTPESIVWQTQKMINIPSSDAVVVAVRPSSEQGTTEILAYAQDHPKFFWKVTQEITRLHLNILSADIYTGEAGMALQVFHVLDKEGQLCQEPFDIETITTRLADAVRGSGNKDAAFPEYFHKKQQAFDLPASITFENADKKQFTELHISIADRPGLLADIAGVLVENNIDIQRAFIATVSEKAMDVLHIATREGEQLSSSEQISLRNDLFAALNQPG